MKFPVLAFSGVRGFVGLGPKVLNKQKYFPTHTVKGTGGSPFVFELEVEGFLLLSGSECLSGSLRALASTAKCICRVAFRTLRSCLARSSFCFFFISL